MFSLRPMLSPPRAGHILGAVQADSANGRYENAERIQR